MTSTHDGREAGHGSRASDSAKCLLVVGGYVQNVSALQDAVDKVEDRIEMSPSMVDFFEIRLVDMGVRPEPSADVSPGVARLALEFTSRPDDAERNFSALIVVDSRASAIDRVFRACRTNEVMSKLNVHYRGLASKDDRQPPTSPSPASSTDDVRIVGTPDGRQPHDQIVANIYRQTEVLLHDFGSGGERSVTGTSLNKIGSEAEPSLRRVIATSAKADEEAALRVREAEAMAQAELRKQAEAQRRQAEERQRAEIRRREAEERRLAEIRQREAEERRLAELQRRQEADRMTEEIRKKYEAQRGSEEQPPATGQAGTEDQHVSAPAGSGQPPDAPDKPPDPPPDDSSQPPAGMADTPLTQPDSPAKDSRQQPVDGCHQRGGDSQQSGTRRSGGIPAVLSSGAHWVESSLRRALEPVRNVPEPEPEPTDIARMLRECVAALSTGDRKRAKARLSALRARADGEFTVEDQLRCRDIVIRDRLMRPEFPVGNLGGEFYDLVLRLAFGQPFRYPQYCDVENCLAQFGRYGSLPHRRPVLEAIDRIETPDVRVLALTRYHLGSERLQKWFQSHQVDVRGLVTALAAGKWPIPEHAEIAFTVLGFYLDKLGRGDDRRAAAAALRDHGYLAGALYQRYHNSTAPQVSLLIPILRAAYPHGMNATDVAEVFNVSVPTPALVRAALRTLATPDVAFVVIREFTRGLGHDEIDAVQEARLVELFMTDHET